MPRETHLMASWVILSSGSTISSTGVEGDNPWVWDENLLYDNTGAENCMKIRARGANDWFISTQDM